MRDTIIISNKGNKIAQSRQQLRTERMIRPHVSPSLLVRQRIPSVAADSISSLSGCASATHHKGLAHPYVQVCTLSCSRRYTRARIHLLRRSWVHAVLSPRPQLLAQSGHLFFRAACTALAEQQGLPAPTGLRSYTPGSGGDSRRIPYCTICSGMVWACDSTTESCGVLHEHSDNHRNLDSKMEDVTNRDSKKQPAREQREARPGF